ncbi:hypothetical protein Ciccas_012499 [Cichlidogyrus casuarinus]|uniref:POGZ/Z280C-D-like double Zinc finger domain-containing protein n=1 Tax=Cichlidogyrus casuarinus TaxID=1844966 RepID=A0ABD2PP76_9PLAT
MTRHRNKCSTVQQIDAQLSPPGELLALFHCHSNQGLRLSSISTKLSGVCFECGDKFREGPLNHFASRFVCRRCSFQTCCASYAKRHVCSQEPLLQMDQLLARPLLCACGYKSINIQAVIRHMAQCKSRFSVTASAGHLATVKLDKSPRDILSAVGLCKHLS